VLWFDDGFDGGGGRFTPDAAFGSCYASRTLQPPTRHITLRSVFC